MRQPRNEHEFNAQAQPVDRCGVKFAKACEPSTRRTDSFVLESSCAEEGGQMREARCDSEENQPATSLSHEHRKADRSFTRLISLLSILLLAAVAAHTLGLI